MQSKTLFYRNFESNFTNILRTIFLKIIAKIKYLFREILRKIIERILLRSKRKTIRDIMTSLRKTMKAGLLIIDASKEQVAELRTWIEDQGFDKDIECYKVYPRFRHIFNNDIFKLLVKEVEKNKIDILFVISLDQIGDDFDIVDMMCIYSVYDVPIISRRDEWTTLDECTKNFILLAKSYRLGFDDFEELDEWFGEE
jgi:hypothetical protein